MDQTPKPPSYLLFLAANAQKRTRELASWEKFVFSSLLAVAGMYFQWREGLRNPSDAVKLLPCVVLAYPSVWATVFVWNLFFAPHRIFREQWTKIRITELERESAKKSSELAARLVRVLYLIKDSESSLRLRPTDPRNLMERAPIGETQEQSNKRYDEAEQGAAAGLHMAKDWHEGLRVRFEELAPALASLAKDNGIDWEPVFHLIHNWRTCNADGDKHVKGARGGAEKGCT